MLLVLDDLEQVIDAAPDVSELLSFCPNLALLVTSRELLRIRGEVEYAVPPLTGREAVELFSERSGLTSDDTIAELCERLDNLPLAVELAAARANTFSPGQFLTGCRSGSTCSWAAGTPRPAADAARDDRVVLELLSPEERELLCPPVRLRRLHGGGCRGSRGS